MSGKRFLVFVYGTLKTNNPNHFYLTDKKNGMAKFICHGTTCERFPMVIGTRYHTPFLVKVPNTGYEVNGEIYEVDETMLAILDELEVHPTYYLRQEIPINGDNGSKYVCWTYFLRQYPKDFLENRQFLKNYDSSEQKPYVMVKDRPTTPKAIDDLGYRSS